MLRSVAGVRKRRTKPGVVVLLARAGFTVYLLCLECM